MTHYLLGEQVYIDSEPGGHIWTVEDSDLDIDGSQMCWCYNAIADEGHWVQANDVKPVDPNRTDYVATLDSWTIL